MGIFKKVRFIKILRWSYTVPILCYMVFVVMIWMLRVPLGSKVKPHILPEDSFEVRLKNSNFNSDQTAMTDADNKNEYLINVNEGENARMGPTHILTEVFNLADVDRSNKLDVRELSTWIRKKILQHISEAIGSNKIIFLKIDINPADGVVTWAEYHQYFLKKRGFSSHFVNKHDEKRHRGVPRSVKEHIMRDRALWAEAAKSNPTALTADEFLAFRHPESSVPNHLALVDELYDKFDKDGDEFLTEDEFAVLQTEGAGEEPVVVRQDEQERRKEFRTSIDLNRDGKADRRELLHYVAPQSPRHADHEAEALLHLADADHDNELSLDEMLAHPDLFLKSKMIDTARSFHDEF